MKYKEYTTDDLIKDEYFQQWVFSPNEESNRFWIDFLENYPGHRERVEEARQFLSFFQVKDKDVFESRVSNLKKRINMSIDQPPLENIPATPPAEKKPAKKMSRSRVRRIVTSLMVMVIGIVAVIMSLFSKHDTAEEIVDLSDHSEVVAARGKRELVVLGDGSRVFLNADSKVKFLKDFNSMATREITVEGQVYIEVAEDLRKPFVVTTSKAILKGLAGAFSVTAYPESPVVEAILVNGRITLESRQQPVNQVTLAPDQRVVFDKETERMSFDNQVRAQSLTAWKDGRLVFENLSLRDIKVMLERWYNVTITIEDEGSLGCYFSGQFYNKSLKEVLEMMKTSDDVSVRVEGHRAVIRGKLCED